MDHGARSGAVAEHPTADPSLLAPAPEAPGERWLLGRYDYPVSHRLLELASFTAFVVLGALVVQGAVGAFADRLHWWSVFPLLAAAVGGLAVADLMSGLVHFLFDQYGSPATPVIGQKFVKPFRDHHDDPAAMTHGDFIAVNSDNLLICLPVLGLTVGLVDLRAHPVVDVFVLALVSAVAMTNQIHKWAHMPRVPGAVRFAQRHGVILGVRHHAGHHRAPYEKHYCITFGRLDVLLDPVTRRLLAHRTQPSTGTPNG
jgi:ubiquitin-conjugating enzyme E2 variant